MNIYEKWKELSVQAIMSYYENDNQKMGVYVSFIERVFYVLVVLEKYVN